MVNVNHGVADAAALVKVQSLNIDGTQDPPCQFLRHLHLFLGTILRPLCLLLGLSNISGPFRKHLGP